MLAGRLWLSAMLAGTAVAAPDEGLRLNAERQATQDVRLDWVGGGPTYHVYRSTNPTDVTAAGNELGQTAAQGWLDSPPAGTLFFYRVLGVMTPCTSDGQCTSDEFCGSTSVCLPDRDDGMTCGGSSHCFSAHCANGYCCAAGDCCASSVDCGAYGLPATCAVPATCQGTRASGSCASSMCSSIVLPDDSACSTAVQSQSCGAYPSVTCTGATTQTPPACPTSCAGDAGCDADAHCDAAACLPDLSNGAVCDEHSDCTTALCVDGVCCNSGCGGTCGACDVPGSVGTCSAIPSGTDPAAECGGVTCSSFYWGWSGDTCFRKADVTAGQASCGGDNACRTQSEECTASSVQGPSATACHATCQQPNVSTCTGTLPGACTNLNPGSQTCGTGPCRVTPPLCSAGSPVTCVPNSGAGSPETCNGIDDNCDGAIDNGALSDSFEPNGSCAAFRSVNPVGSDGTQTYNTQSVYPFGDSDYYRFVASETDSSCGCGALSFDEDYRLTTSLTVPPGAGVYELCISMTCDAWAACTTVNPGTTAGLVWDLDGACGPGTEDDYAIFVRVRGVTSPGFTCQPYALSYNFDAGRCF